MSGPFEPALAVTLPTQLIKTRALQVNAEAGKPKGPIVCIEGRVSQSEITSYKKLGEIVIDSEMIAWVDQATHKANIKKSIDQRYLVIGAGYTSAQ